MQKKVGIGMKANTMLYCLQQGFKNVRSNKVYSIASICVVAATLFLFGVLLAAVLNVQHVMQDVEQQVGITVFFDEDINQNQIDNIGKEIEAMPQVLSISYTTAEKAWAEFSAQMFQDQTDLIEGFGDDNPLEGSDSYTVTLHNIEEQKEVADHIKKIAGVRQVKNAEDTAKGLSTINMLIGYACASIILTLVGVAVFLINITISSGIFARKEELAIMKLIGATDAFVKAPFVIEGVIIGIVGSIIPIFLLYLAYDKVINYSADRFSIIANLVDFLPTRQVITYMAPASLGIGLGIGLIGSYITTRRHLKV